MSLRYSALSTSYLAKLTADFQSMCQDVIEGHECPLLALSRHCDPCPLTGVKRTSHGHAPMSAYDPKRTLSRICEHCLWVRCQCGGIDARDDGGTDIGLRAGTTVGRGRGTGIFARISTSPACTLASSRAHVAGTSAI